MLKCYHMTKSFSTVIFIVVAFIVLYSISKTLINEDTLPPLSDYLASTTEQIAYKKIQIQAPNGVINAEISDNPITLTLGLSGRQSLDEDAGMVFLFKDIELYDFWMKDMKFPIDIIWIDSEKKVVGIEKNVSPDTYPETFASPIPLSTVLELNAFGSEKFGIATGTILVF